MKPTVGRIVNYILTEENVKQIMRRRTHGGAIATAIAEGKWSIGAQAHIGNSVAAGQIIPMMIVAVWSETTVNGQGFLDGTDVFWITSTQIGDGQGNWNWVKREE